MPENYYMDQITCPYCAYEFRDSWELGDADDVECPECGKTFSFISEVDVYYHSQRNCLLNEEAHEWPPFGNVVEKCLKCDQRRVNDAARAQLLLFEEARE